MGWPGANGRVVRVTKVPIEPSRDQQARVVEGEGLLLSWWKGSRLGKLGDFFGRYLADHLAACSLLTSASSAHPAALG